MVHPKYAGTDELKQLATLGRVSRRWNRILYSTPRLCTDLFLWVPNDGNLDDLVSPLRWWMEISRNTPLSLTVSALKEPTKAARFIFIILNNKTVWKELRLQFPCADGFIICDSAFENRWVPLEALSLGSYTGSMLSQNGVRPIHMGEFPRLKSLYLAYKDVILPHHFNLPWSKLTDLTLFLDNTVEQYICIIQHCPDLESLNLTFCNPMDPITPLPSVVLSNLQQLSIKDMRGVRLLLPSIQCPALTSFQIISFDQPFNEHDSNALRAFFSKATKLTELTLDISLDDNDLVYLLKETPSLADLYIRAAGVNGEFVMPLSDGYLTKLHTLDIEGAPDERSRRKFHDFVRSRQAESTTYTRLEHASLVNVS